jgi:transposase-like protein
MTNRARSGIRRKLRILKHAQKTGNVSKTCRYFGISREIFYQWKRAYEALGDTALIDSKPCPQNPKIRVSEPIEDKILYI